MAAGLPLIPQARPLGKPDRSANSQGCVSARREAIAMRCQFFHPVSCWALLLLLTLGWSRPASGTLFYNRKTFELGAHATTDVTFEGLAGLPANYTPYPAGLELNGVQFQGEIPGDPPSESLFVIDPLYHTDYNRGSGDVLSPGIVDGQVTIELPGGITAVGFDIATFGSAGDNLAFVVASSGGPDPVLIFATTDGPESGRAFVGFSGDTPIIRVTIVPSASAILLIDNLRFGQISPALLPGDANGDGFVDAGDYTAWADHFFQIGRSFDQGDFSADGIVDGADYTLWADNFAEKPFAATLLLSTATPEPSTLLLAVVGGGLALAMTRLRARKRNG
jgi:hypothetical protein